MRSISDDPNKTEFTWLLNTNLKVNSLFFLFIASISVASTSCVKKSFLCSTAENEN